MVAILLRSPSIPGLFSQTPTSTLHSKILQATSFSWVWHFLLIYVSKNSIDLSPYSFWIKMVLKGVKEEDVFGLRNNLWSFLWPQPKIYLPLLITVITDGIRGCKLPDLLLHHTSSTKQLVEIGIIFVTAFIKESSAAFCRFSSQTIYSLLTWVDCFISLINHIIEE